MPRRDEMPNIIRRRQLQARPDLPQNEISAKASKTPHVALALGLGSIITSLVKTGGMTAYVAGGALMVVGSFTAAAIIKQRKKRAREQRAASAPETF